GKACTPEHPVGPCMVSSEGACSIVYKFKRELCSDSMFSKINR
ncbi:MAG: hypothetical protein J7K58_01160, partial [Euryarchaeota archaeon]|nr:hypothetical protein [Euryarchaeota archaeon]